MSSVTPTTPTPRPWRAGDLLTYRQAAVEFPELTERYLRYKYELGCIDAYPGAGGRNYFLYEDLVALRLSTRTRYASKKSTRRRRRRPTQPRDRE